MVLAFFSLSAQQILKETFANGIPNDWTTVEVLGNGTSTANWFHTTQGPSGNFSIGPINSTTASDGWAIFDSDLNCNQGVGQNAWLITPQLDISGMERVFLSFESHYQRFYDAARVRVGTDLNDLDSWLVIDTLFFEVITNEFLGVIYGDAGLNSVPIQYELTDDVSDWTNIYIGFQFLSDASTVPASLLGLEGCAFSWQIDDVIVSSLDQELFMGVLPRGIVGQEGLIINGQPIQATNYSMPYLLRDTFFIASPVGNLGNVAKNNIIVDVEIEEVVDPQNFTTQTVFTTSMSRSTSIEPGGFPFLESNEFFYPEKFEPAFYFVNYNIRQVDEFDEIIRNNRTRTRFQYTNARFAKDNAVYDADARGADGGILRRVFSATRPGTVNQNNWEMGNHYFMPDYPDNCRFPIAGDNTGFIDSLIARTVDFTVASEVLPEDPTRTAHAGQTVLLFLYEIARDDILDVFDDNDLVAVGFGEFTFPNEAINFDLYTANIVDASGVRGPDEGVYLKPDTEYLVTVQYKDFMFAPYTANTYQVFQRSTYVKNGNWFENGFGKEVTSITRLNVQFITDTGKNCPTSTKLIELDDNQLQLFPNPTNTELTVSIELKETSPVLVKVIDITGRVLQERRLDDTSLEQFNLDVSNYPVGTYLLNVTANEGVKTKMFVIQR